MAGDILSRLLLRQPQQDVRLEILCPRHLLEMAASTMQKSQQQIPMAVIQWRGSTVTQKVLLCLQRKSTSRACLVELVRRREACQERRQWQEECQWRECQGQWRFESLRA